MRNRNAPLFDPLDSGFSATKLTFPIHSEDSIVRIWNHGLEKEIMSEVRRTNTWRAVDIFRRGYEVHALDNPIEIVVTFEKMALEENPDDISQRLWRLCSEAGRPDIQIELREGLVQRLTDEPGLYLETPYAQHLRASSSISALGGPSGTMGGFLELAEEAGEPKVLGLTCHHVAFHTKERSEGS